MESFKLLGQDELAAVASPFRQKLLAELSVPQSAIHVARKLEMSRQRVGYHMRDLESAGAIACVSRQKARGLTEKLYQAQPMAFASAPDTERARMAEQDRFSWSALVNLIGQTLWDLMGLRRAADAKGKRLATMAIEAELHFASPAERKAFSEDLLDAVEQVIRKHERPETEETRGFRLILGAYPKFGGGKASEREANTKH